MVLGLFGRLFVLGFWFRLVSVFVFAFFLFCFSFADLNEGVCLDGFVGDGQDWWRRQADVQDY